MVVLWCDLAGYETSLGCCRACARVLSSAECETYDAESRIVCFLQHSTGTEQDGRFHTYIQHSSHM